MFTNPLTQEQTSVLLILATVLLFGIFVAVIVMIFQNRPSIVRSRLDNDVDRALKRLGKATEMHAEVAGAVAYLDQIQARPELIANLGEYSRQALAASLMQRLAILAGTAKAVQAELSKAEANRAKYGNTYASQAKICREQLTQLEKDQQALQQLADQLTRLPLRAV